MDRNAAKASVQTDDDLGAGPLHRILVADSDAEHFATVRDTLQTEGTTLRLVSSSEELTVRMATERPDVVILDPGFAEGRALAIYREHCREPRPGLVVCTADRSAEMRLACAEAGADHLVYKPVLAEELPLLIDNLLYRLNGEQQADQWVLDSLRWVLHPPQGGKISLTYREMLILDALACSPGRVIPRDMLIETLGFNPADYDIRRLEILVRRLRSKVADATELSLPITTVHGTGYAFTAPVRLIG